MVCHQISSHIVFDRLKSQIKISISSLDKEKKELSITQKECFFLTSRESPDPRKNRIVPRLCASLSLQISWTFNQHFLSWVQGGHPQNSVTLIFQFFNPLSSLVILQKSPQITIFDSLTPTLLGWRHIWMKPSTEKHSSTVKDLNQKTS